MRKSKNAVGFVVGFVTGWAAFVIARLAKQRQMFVEGQCHDQVVTVLSRSPWVSFDPAFLCPGNSIEWTKGDGVERFTIDFGGEKPLRGNISGRPQGKFNERDPKGRALEPHILFCDYKYFKYAISVNDGPLYDPGIIITK